MEGKNAINTFPPQPIGLDGGTAAPNKHERRPTFSFLAQKPPRKLPPPPTTSPPRQLPPPPKTSPLRQLPPGDNSPPPPTTSPRATTAPLNVPSREMFVLYLFCSLFSFFFFVNSNVFTLFIIYLPFQVSSCLSWFFLLFF
jgi:hypothetical protein